MGSNSSDSLTLPVYKLYFDDIEEIFLNSMPFKYLFISSIVVCLATISSIIILLYRAKTIFLACLIPFIYSLVFYDFTQFLSIALLKYNLININEKYFGELCRWPYYLKASSEAGQCLTLIFIFAIRCQKVRYFLKHNHLPNSNHIHSRALTFVGLLFIIYVNNWITHLKVEKIHLVTYNESNYGISIQEYPTTFYGIHHEKLSDHQQFYSDLDKYAENYEKIQVHQSQTSRIIHNQKDGSIHEVIIKIPYGLFGSNKSITQTRTKRTIKDDFSIWNKTTSHNQTYPVHRCTYEQRNFFLANFLSLIHSLFYFVLLSYFLTTFYRYRIPYITSEYHQKLLDRALSVGRKKSAERHKQIMLLTHLRRFQYLVAYLHAATSLIRLIYLCSFTIILCLIQSPFQWLSLKTFYYSLFTVVYYSIPIRAAFLFIYLFSASFSSHIYSIYYYIFCTKLHFSCQLQKPKIRFHLHLVKYHHRNINHNVEATDSFVMDLTSSFYDDRSFSFPNEVTGLYEDNSNSQQIVTTNPFEMINEIEHV